MFRDHDGRCEPARSRNRVQYASLAALAHDRLIFEDCLRTM